MTDGYAVASYLRDNEPDVYEILNRAKWVFFNRSPEHDHRWSGPIIDHGAPGSPLTFRTFHPVRAFPDMPENDLPFAYEALRRFSQLARSDEYQLRSVFSPGELVAFDNRRILHGRGPFSETTGSKIAARCLCRSRRGVFATASLDASPTRPETLKMSERLK